MKKVICGILAAVMAMSMCACDNDRDDDREDRKDREKEETRIEKEIWEEEYQENEMDMIPSYEEEEYIPMTEPVDQAPDTETLQRIYNYFYMVGDLKYDEERDTIVSNVKEKYEQMLAMRDLQPWLETEYATAEYLVSMNYRMDMPFDETTDRDWQYIVDNFFVVPDGAYTYSCTTTDNLGNVNTANNDNYATFNHYQYYPNGQYYSINQNFLMGVEYLLDEGFFSNLSGNRWTYDEEGRPSKIYYYGYDGKISNICTYHYNEQGQLTERSYQTNQITKTKTHEYNELGQLVKMTWDKPNGYNETTEINYQYDENGNLVWMAKYHRLQNNCISAGYVYTFRYDANGNIIGGTYEEQDWFYPNNYIKGRKTDTFTLVRNEQNQIVQVTVIPGDREALDAQGNVTGTVVTATASTVYDITYEDYYGYCSTDLNPLESN